jgi:predicted PurR-regulated permease PerM
MEDIKMKERQPVSRDLTHTILAALSIGVLIAASFWILSPFLISIIWAGLIVIATWPVLERFEKRFAKKRGIAVALMTILLLLTILVPITFAIVTIVDNADTIAVQVKSLSTFSLSSPPDWLERIPLAGEKLSARWMAFAALNPEERSARVVPYVQKAFTWFVAQAGSMGMTMLHFLLTVIIAAILYAKGEVVKSGFLSFARRLAGVQGEEVAILAAKAVRGVVLGVVLTAIIQATIGGIGLFIAGVPAAGLLTAVMVMLCLAQIGPFLVLVPAVIWLYWSGQPVWGTVLLVVTLVAGTIDNVIRPFLIKKGADLPLVLIFSGVIGGLIAFGIVGLFIGPVVLAVTYTLLKAWVKGDVQEEAEDEAEG